MMALIFSQERRLCDTTKEVKQEENNGCIAHYPDGFF